MHSRSHWILLHALIVAAVVIPFGTRSNAQVFFQQPSQYHQVGCFGVGPVAEAAHHFDEFLQHFVGVMHQVDSYSHLAEDAREVASLSAHLHETAEEGVDCVHIRKDYHEFKRAFNHLRVTYGAEYHRHPNQHIEQDWRKLQRLYRQLNSAVFHSSMYSGLQACRNSTQIANSVLEFTIDVTHFRNTVNESAPGSHLAKDLGELSDKAEHLLNVAEEREDCNHIRSDFAEIEGFYSHLKDALYHSYLNQHTHEAADWREVEQAYQALHNAIVHGGWGGHSSPHSIPSGPRPYPGGHHDHDDHNHHQVQPSPYQVQPYPYQVQPSPYQVQPVPWNYRRN